MWGSVGWGSSGGTGTGALIPQDANAIVHVTAQDLHNGTSHKGPIWTMNGTVPYNANAMPRAQVGPFSASNYFSLAAGNVLNFAAGTAWTACAVFKPGTVSFIDLILQSDSTGVTGYAALWRGDSGLKGEMVWNNLAQANITANSSAVGSLSVLMFGFDAAGVAYVQLNNGTLSTTGATTLTSGSTQTNLGNGSIGGGDTLFMITELLVSSNTPSGSAFTTLYNAVIANSQN